jgi:putative transcriptional regulator
VILIIDHTEEGSMGLVINKEISVPLNDLLPDFAEAPEIPLYRGGPMGNDTLFFLHTLPHVKDAIRIRKGLYLNGDFDAIKQYVLSGNQVSNHIRFFLGYSGWNGEQLSEEIKGNTWLVSEEEKAYLMDDAHTDEMWKRAMRAMGTKYEAWSRFPLMPILN